MNAKDLAESLRNIAGNIDTSTMDLAAALDAEADRIDPSIPDRPAIPAGHMAWKEADGGGLRISTRDEWYIANDNGVAIQGGSCGKRWMLSPEAPEGYRHVPADEGGGYRPWKSDEWFINEKGDAEQAGPTDYTPNNYWIIAPDTFGGVMFVEDEDGEWAVDSLGGLRRTRHYDAKHHRRRCVPLTPAQVAAAMAVREGE